MGMSACVRGHPQTVLLARPPCAEDCIWPPGGHNPVLRTWKRSTIGGEKGPRTSSGAGTWPGPGRFISQPGFLGDGFLSFFFFYGCTAMPRGGPFLHTARPSFLGGLLHMSCGSAGSRLGGKLQIKCGLSQRLGCSLCACSQWLATFWPPDTKSGPRKEEAS